MHHFFPTISEYHGKGQLEKALECAGKELAISCNNQANIVIHEAFFGRSEEGKI